ncbi:MAG: replication-associated recombination protein A [Planctomycetaceae bacterium]|nr:replication-associated recombination protein A [Planctomycetaceae bacterium]
MPGLFDHQERAHRDAARPLASRMRPRNVDEFVGQQHFLGEGKLLRRMLQADRLSSLIFFGPPGTGKTSLAEVIARQTKSRFRELNAASAGVKELRTELEDARRTLSTSGERTLLFVDELHHFNKTQQDVLLPDVEHGVVILIGATTANPFFSLVSALISRSQVFEFQPLTKADILALLQRAVADRERGLGQHGIDYAPDALDFLADICDGDARRALSALEIGVLSLVSDSTPSPRFRGEGGRRPGEGRTSVDSHSHPVFDLTVAQESIQKKAILYDSKGDQHYDVTSAFIKSIRGSDPDAALYWLARMLEAGEDPRFIARRIVIAASEDIGNADPHALVLANAAAEATERVGMPECRIILSQAVTYLSCAPKSNAAYVAINAALDDVRNQRVIPVPVHLQDSHYGGAKQLGHGQGYQYAHDAEGGWVDQDYLGVEKTYYEPTDRGKEAEFKQRLDELRSQRKRRDESRP